MSWLIFPATQAPETAETMAERSNATSKKKQDPAPDVSTLQKRGRRRLVGAIALVLFAVIVLPMVFDPEPKPNAPTVNIRIPSEEGTKFTPKVSPTGPQPDARSQPSPGAPQPVAPAQAEKPMTAAATPEASRVEPRVEPKAEPKADPGAEPKSEAKAESKPERKAEPKAKPDASAESKPAKKAAVEKPAGTPAKAETGGERYVVQVGAFATPEKVKERTEILKRERLPYYTETVAAASGPVTRIRLGPFSSIEAAQKARERAKALDMNPANPTAK
ncbi:MAG: SPOR domain-containing protein [Betaproteobacteria bacterium]